MGAVKKGKGEWRLEREGGLWFEKGKGSTAGDGSYNGKATTLHSAHILAYSTPAFILLQLAAVPNLVPNQHCGSCSAGNSQSSPSATLGQDRKQFDDRDKYMEGGTSPDI